MTTFGWKRKTGENLVKVTYSQSVFDAEDTGVILTDLKFSSKRQRVSSDENLKIKTEEFKQNGTKLAEEGRFFEAIKTWDKALQLAPSDAKILEMKAQALLQINSPCEALQASRKAVMCNPLWWVAYQTLGRSQLNVGEIKMAVVSFSKAIHLNPESRELWEDDLNWAAKLLQEENQNKEVVPDPGTDKEDALKS